MRNALLLTALIGCSNPTADRLDRARTAVANNTGLSVPLVTISDMMSAYRSNALSANEKYSGRVLRIWAPVDRVIEAKDGTAVVILRDGGGEVSCWLDDRTEAVSISRSDLVTVRGYGVGEVDGRPALIACKVEIK